ncbi:MAG: hypothetical protein EGP82_05740 [Odoribacter splanchnicus]|nr:hypothetical protein [Odoribacter splanchnicus]
MKEEEKNVPVGDTSNNQQVAGQSLHNENQELKAYYLHQLQLMFPTIVTDKSDSARLAILKQRIDRLVEMLALFEHSWTDEVPVLQKACLSYLATEIISRKERQQVIDAWSSWSNFQFKFARYRGLLTRFLQYHHRIVQELESLHYTGNAKEAPESQELNQEGGI